MTGQYPPDGKMEHMRIAKPKTGSSSREESRERQTELQRPGIRTFDRSGLLLSIR